MNEFDQERTVTLAVALSYDEVEAPRVTAKETPLRTGMVMSPLW